MENITFDSTSFSEQLGIYDFFNVILSGSIFVCGLCIINQNINNYILNNLSLRGYLGLILLIYIAGMVLQEIGSIVDRQLLKIYKGMNQSILKGKIDDKYKEKTTNKIVENPLVLERYRHTASKLLAEFTFDNNEPDYESKYVNGYVFSVCQYYVSIHGKDKKVEKIRALFAMSKTLLCCFFLLAFFSIVSIGFTNVKPIISICDVTGLSNIGYTDCIDKIMLTLFFAVIGIFFIFRAKRTMRNFLLILLGTYDALMRADENKPKKQRVAVNVKGGNSSVKK